MPRGGHHGFHSHHGGYHGGFHGGFHSRGRGGPPIPWYYWAKNRGTVGVGVISAITLAGTLVDFILAGTLYYDQIGSIAGVLVELNVILLCLQVVHFGSIFKPTWIVCGYYCQLAIVITGFVAYFPIHLALGLTIEKSNEVDSFKRIGMASVEMCVIGGVFPYVLMMTMFIWNSTVRCKAMTDPEFISYMQRISPYFPAVLMCNPTIIQAGVVQPGIAQTAIVQPGMPVGYPMPQPAGVQRMTTSDQISQLQAQVDELKRRQMASQPNNAPSYSPAPVNVSTSPILPSPCGYQEVPSSTKQ